MERLNGTKNVEKPALELTVTADGEEVAVLAFFKAPNLGWDVVVGIADWDLREPLRDAFELAKVALRDARRPPLEADSDEGASDFPF